MRHLSRLSVRQREFRYVVGLSNVYQSRLVLYITSPRNNIIYKFGEIGSNIHNITYIF